MNTYGFSDLGFFFPGSFREVTGGSKNSFVIAFCIKLFCGVLCSQMQNLHPEKIYIGIRFLKWKKRALCCMLGSESELRLM